MQKSNSYDPQEFDDLSQRIDSLLDEAAGKSDAPESGIDLSPYTPADTDSHEGMVFQNYSNQYGRADGQNGQHPQAYNQDLLREQRRQANRDEYRDYGREPTSTASRKAARAHRKARPKGCCGCGCATVLLAAVALVAVVLLFLGSLFRVPQSEDSLGERKKNTAAILLCGTDKDGTRTDTMMLVYLDGEENRVGLLSLPRDTLTITDSGKRAKLNSAYGRNGCGEEGMEWTLNYVQDIIGYRPDGYILVDMELVPKVVDLMGGVDVHLDHHIRINNDGEEEIYIPEGDQHLDGREVLATLRYRYGYANADLGRVQVQRMVITECMKQWVSPTKLTRLPKALDLIEAESLTDLELNNFLWIGKTILTGMGNMTSDTLPGYAQNRGGASYFILYPEKVAALVNESYNPYNVVIHADDLDIAE